MKEIIYLDTSIINSFIAQEFDGLPLQMSNETQTQTTKASEQSAGTNSRSFVEGTGKTGEFSLPGLFKTPSGQLKVRIQPGKSTNEKFLLSEVEAGKEIISKQLHDNGLTLLEDFLEKTNRLKETPKVGDYIKVKTPFSLFDFEQFGNIFNQDYFDLFMNPNELPQEVEDIILQTKSKGLSKKQESEEIKRITSEYKKIVEQNIAQLKKTVGVFKYVEKALPTSAIVKVDNIVANLKDEFLREDSKSLFFKYNSNYSKLNITIVGKVTAQLSDLRHPDFTAPRLDTFLMDMNKLLIALLGDLNFIKVDDYLISPIALYFD